MDLSFLYNFLKFISRPALVHIYKIACAYTGCLLLLICVSASWLRLKVERGDWLPKAARVHSQAVDHGRLYDYGIIPIAKIVTESFFFSFGYGACTVLICNALLPGAMPDDAGWLIVLLAQFASGIFASTFSGSSFHATTSTRMHFFYFTAGLLPIMLYDPLPHWWAVLGCCFCSVVLFAVVRHILYDKYPMWWSTHPLYSRNKFTGEPSLISMPRLGGDALFKSAWRNGMFTTLANTYLMFPVFEILHLELVVGLAIGFIVGILGVYTPLYKVITMLSAQHSWPLTDSDALVLSTLILTELAWLWRHTIGLGSVGYGDVYRTLSRFHPRLLDFVTINLGAVAMLRVSDIEDLSIPSVTAKAIISILVYANHFIGILVFVLSLATATGHEDSCVQKLMYDDYRYVQIENVKIETEPYKYILHHRRKYEVDKFLTQRLHGFELLQFIAADWDSFHRPSSKERFEIAVQHKGV